MKFDNLSRFKNGWILGDFEPSILSTKQIDLGIIHCEKGHRSDGHYHKLHEEYNIIIFGKAKIGDNVYSEGDIFVYAPYEKSEIEYLENTKLLVVKIPATKNDKYY